MDEGADRRWEEGREILPALNGIRQTRYKGVLVVTDIREALLYRSIREKVGDTCFWGRVDFRYLRDCEVASTNCRFREGKEAYHQDRELDPYLVLQQSRRKVQR